MKIELHLIQNFAPSCLNRDDTGAPKDCDFGGFRRARVSSQCFKRAIRETFEDHLPEGASASVRSKRLAEKVAEALAGMGRQEVAPGSPLIEFAFQQAGEKLKKTTSGDDDVESVATQYLLFVPTASARAFAQVIDANWDTLTELAEAKKPKVPKELRTELADALFDARRTPSIALFGRMVANSPEVNVDAACQVAHAISTHAVSMEFDFFTAVDDLAGRDETGAGMMGTIGFNSACLYRYLVIDTHQLAHNLAGGDSTDEVAALTAETIGSMIRATVAAIPSARQNTMAAHNPPSFVLAVVRDRGAPVSLANAFQKPVHARRDGDLVEASVRALDAHLGSILRMFGSDDVRRAAWCSLDDSADLQTILPGSSLLGDRASRVGSIDDLVAEVMGVRAEAS